MHPMFANLSKKSKSSPRETSESNSEKSSSVNNIEKKNPKNDVRNEVDDDEADKSLDKPDATAALKYYSYFIDQEILILIFFFDKE